MEPRQFLDDECEAQEAPRYERNDVSLATPTRMAELTFGLSARGSHWQTTELGAACCLSCSILRSLLIVAALQDRLQTGAEGVQLADE